MRNKNAKKRTSHRRQKMYNMKGCSSFFCNTKKRNSKRNNKRDTMKGGCGGTCPMNHSMIGGYLRKHSIKHSVKKRNKKSTQRESSSSSHDSHESHRIPSSQKGGMFQDATNLFRSVGFSAGSVYNAVNGYGPPVNPSPAMDQFKSTFGKV